MHVIIAGTARAGKTSLALKLKDEFVHYKMDSIKRGICEAYNISYDDWAGVSPVMCRIINRIIEDNKTDTNFQEEKYLFDTPFLYPEDISLINTEETIVVFLGYPKLTAKENFDKIRKYDKENYWTTKIPDDKLLEWCKDNVDFSIFLEEECKKYHIPFFDTSHNREEVLKEAEKFIQEKEEQNESYTKRVKEEII